ncbi:MAG: DUF2079 domain-containing protein [Verrucomicrobiia bacterium]|jgi:uncharacterized membrane protein
MKDNLRKWIAQHRKLLLWLGGYTVFFFVLAWRKYAVMNSNSGDAWAMIEAFNCTLRGKLMYIPTYEMSYLGNHASLIVLWVVPLFWLLPTAPTLYFAQSLSIGLSGIPFYLLSRKVLDDRRAASLLTAAYLFYPTVVTMHVDQLHLEVFGLPFLMAAAYFFFEARFFPFVIFALLGMMGQENLPFTVAAFGVYAAVRRRNIKWIVVPILLAAIYEVFALKVFMPYFAGPEGMSAVAYHTLLGLPPKEFIHAALTNPLPLLAYLTDAEHVFYLMQVFQPLLWVAPLLAPEFLLVVPALGMNLALDSASRVIAWHYGLATGAFLCVATIFGVRNISQVLEARWNLAHARLMLSACICALCIASWPFWLEPSQFATHAYYPTLEKVLALIPPDKSVLAPMSMIAHFSDREDSRLQACFSPEVTRKSQLRGFLVWPQEDMYKMDYVIFDANDRRFPPNVATRDLVMSYYTNTNYQLVFNENNVFVFRRRESVPIAR